MAEKQQNVPVDQELYSQLEEYIKSSEFNSVPEFVDFVLREVLKDDQAEEEYSEEEEKEVKSRLRALGYIE